MTIQMHRMYCGDDALSKSLRFGYITASLDSSSSTIIKWVTDSTTDTYTLPTTFVSSRWGTGIWGYGLWGSANSSNYRVQMSGTGYYIDVSIIDAGQTIPVFGRFQLETFALGRR
jgi:hypothetical protein